MPKNLLNKIDAEKSFLTLTQVDNYLCERKGSFDQRSIRFKETVKKLYEWNLTDNQTIVDCGAGWTELDYFLRTENNWRGRYYPIDAGLDGIDLEQWFPNRNFDYIVALEILEHLKNPENFLQKLIKIAKNGIICSVPNPETVDVLAIDKTHISIPDKKLFQKYGFVVEEKTFYDGFYSNGKPDALFAYLKN